METRERIIQEATKLLLQMGPTSMTMDSVSSACGISKRTLYEIFPNKHALIAECMRVRAAGENEKVAQIFASSANCYEALFKVYTRVREVYRSVSTAFFNDIKRLYPELFESEQQQERHHIAQLGEVLRQAQNEGLVSKRIDPLMASLLFSCTMRDLQQNQRMMDFGFNKIDVFEQAFICFLRGISTAKGICIIDDFQTNQPQQMGNHPNSL